MKERKNEHEIHSILVNEEKLRYWKIVFIVVVVAAAVFFLHLNIQ